MDPGEDARGGLGLAICKGLVEAHGGRIRAESAGEGRGLRVTFTLPVAEEPKPVLSPDEPPPRAGEKIPILVVDDDPNALRSLREALAAAGYAPAVTGDPDEIPGLVEAKRPRLALLDLALPGADGITLMQTLPALAGLPVIFVSAYGREETVARALEAGAADYIVKPFSPGELVARVRAALRRETAHEPEPFRLGDLVIDYALRRVTVAGHPVRLTATEYELLRVLSLDAAGCRPTIRCCAGSGTSRATATCSRCGASSGSCAASSARTRRGRPSSSTSAGSATACQGRAIRRRAAARTGAPGRDRGRGGHGPSGGTPAPLPDGLPRPFPAPGHAGPGRRRRRPEGVVAACLAAPLTRSFTLKVLKLQAVIPPPVQRRLFAMLQPDGVPVPGVPRPRLRPPQQAATFSNGAERHATVEPRRSSPPSLTGTGTVIDTLRGAPLRHGWNSAHHEQGSAHRRTPCLAPHDQEPWR